MTATTERMTLWSSEAMTRESAMTASSPQNPTSPMSTRRNRLTAGASQSAPSPRSLPSAQAAHTTRRRASGARASTSGRAREIRPGPEAKFPRGHTDSPPSGTRGSHRGPRASAVTPMLFEPKPAFTTTFPRLRATCVTRCPSRKWMGTHFHRRNQMRQVGARTGAGERPNRDGAGRETRGRSGCGARGPPPGGAAATPSSTGR